MDTQTMRASDRDREDVVDRLRAAVGDGRLRMDEYMERMDRAFQAVTFGDLAPLLTDLPAPGTVVAGQRPTSAIANLRAAPALARRRCFVTGLPAFVPGLPVVLRMLWATWFAAVSINVVVWVLVSGTTGHFIYPWPLWVAGPYGAALLALSAAFSQGRRSQQ